MGPEEFFSQLDVDIPYIINKNMICFMDTGKEEKSSVSCFDPRQQFSNFLLVGSGIRSKIYESTTPGADLDRTE